MGFDGKINSKQDYFLFVKHLESFEKEESVEDKKRHIAILNTKQNVIGIAMANIRRVAKQIVKNGYQTFLEIGLNQNNDDEFYEETLIQGLVIAELKDFEYQKQLFEKWVHKIDNWATCDGTVSTMKPLKKSKNKRDYFNFYLGLCYKKEEFVSRFGIITLMTNYLEYEYIDDILKMCEEVKSEHYYVKMGVAWLLSYAFIKFKTKTLEFLEKRVLDKFTQNKTISKCRDSYQVSAEDKEMLIGFRIK